MRTYGDGPMKARQQMNNPNKIFVRKVKGSWLVIWDWRILASFIAWADAIRTACDLVHEVATCHDLH